MDYWEGRFTPATESNAGGGRAMYRTCLLCGGHALEGSESAHARWCDRDREALREQIRREHQLQAWRDRGVL